MPTKRRSLTRQQKMQAWETGAYSGATLRRWALDHDFLARQLGAAGRDTVFAVCGPDQHIHASVVERDGGFTHYADVTEVEPFKHGGAVLALDRWSTPLAARTSLLAAMDRVAAAQRRELEIIEPKAR